MTYEIELTAGQFKDVITITIPSSVLVTVMWMNCILQDLTFMDLYELRNCKCDH